MNMDNKVNSDLEKIVSEAKDDMKKLKLNDENIVKPHLMENNDVLAESKHCNSEQQQVVTIKCESLKAGDKAQKPILRIIPLGKNATVNPGEIKAVLMKNLNLQIYVENTKRDVKKKRDEEFENLLALCKHNIMSLYHERTQKRTRVS